MYVYLLSCEGCVSEGVAAAVASSFEDGTWAATAAVTHTVEIIWEVQQSLHCSPGFLRRSHSHRALISGSSCITLKPTGAINYLSLFATLCFCLTLLLLCRGHRLSVRLCSLSETLFVQSEQQSEISTSVHSTSASGMVLNNKIGSSRLQLMIIFLDHLFK